MSDTVFRFGFRIAGGVHCARKRVDAAAAFDAYRLCEPRARVGEEAYLSAFRFDDAFREHLGRTGTSRGFAGSTWSPHIWFDIDRDASAGGIEQSLIDTCRLADALVRQFSVPLETVMPFFSGSKGFHLGCPTAYWRPTGSPTFHRVTRAFAETIATAAQITIDVSIYDRVRAFRAPNSRHGKTGFHKRFLPPEQLGTLTIDDVVELARVPAPFELPDVTTLGANQSLVAAWAAAEQAVASQDAAAALRQEQRAVDNGAAAKLNRLTLDIIRGEPIGVGDRHRLIYAAARNLAEAGASLSLAQQLLVGPARDSGLSPRDVDRQIRCGFSDNAAADNTHETEA